VDEQSFVNENRPQWERLDAILRKAGKDGFRRLAPEDLAEVGKLYRLVTSDLSIAAARGASNDLTIYLNELVGRAHGLIYASERGPVRNALQFLISGFPELFRASLKPIGLSTLVFALGALFAFALVTNDRSAMDAVVPGAIARGIDENMKDNPAVKGIPDSLKPVLASAIMVNNITVSIGAFATGAAFGVLTVYALLQNGMMLGGLAAFFAGTRSSTDFWALILPHGIIELVAIFIAGGAGFILAGAVIRPGNVSRLESLRIAAQTAVRLMGGVVALLLVAGAIEGFITPSGIPQSSKLLFAAMTAVGLGAYLFAGRRSRTVADSSPHTRAPDAHPARS